MILHSPGKVYISIENLDDDKNKITIEDKNTNPHDINPSRDFVNGKLLEALRMLNGIAYEYNVIIKAPTEEWVKINMFKSNDMNISDEKYNGFTHEIII